MSQPAEPPPGPLGHRRLPETGVDPFAPGLVGLDRGGEPVGIGLAPEVLRPLAAVRPDIADLVAPTAILLLGKGPDVSHACAPPGVCHSPVKAGPRHRPVNDIGGGGQRPPGPPGPHPPPPSPPPQLPP